MKMGGIGTPRQIKNDSLDLGLIADDSSTSYEDLPDPIESAEEAIAELEQAVDLLQQVVKELHVAGAGR